MQRENGWEKKMACWQGIVSIVEVGSIGGEARVVACEYGLRQRKQGKE